MTIIGIHKPKNQRALTLLGFLLECSLILFILALNSNLVYINKKISVISSKPWNQDLSVAIWVVVKMSLFGYPKY